MHATNVANIKAQKNILKQYYICYGNKSQKM